jgi:hypothetical protein
MFKSIKNAKWHRFLPLLYFAVAGCGTADRPLDADTRQRIDSITYAHINLARREMDSLCAAQQTGAMQPLIDSIKQVRLREIEEQLKTIPK